MTVTTDADHRAEQLRQAIRLKKAAARSQAPDLPRRPAEEAAVLGEMQRGLWLVHQMDPESPAYNLASAFRAQGILDVDRLEGAWGTVVARHRLLRSTYRADRRTILQFVHPPSPVTIEVFEVADGEGQAAAVAQARKPFDLEAGPLLRLQVIEQTAGRERILVLVVHHLLADERTLAFLWQELAAAYAGQPTEVGTRSQYDDYVYWFRQRDPRVVQQDLDYWRRQLDPLPEELRLPFEKSVDTAASALSAGRSGAPGRLLARPLGRAVQQGIRRLAAAAGHTPFAVFAFAFRLLLERYTAGQRIAFATPVSTRSHPATAKMIGYFTNLVVVATRIDEGRPLESALGEFSRGLRDALAHTTVSFQALTEELAPSRQQDRHPIFQTMFVYQESSLPPALGDARLRPVTLDLGAAKFDLTLFVTEGESEGEHTLEIAVEYRADRFDEIWMHRLLGHYETLLGHLPADLGCTTAAVQMLGAQELGQLRAFAQGSTARFDMALLPQQILAQARHRPQAPAVVCGGARHSYAALAGLAHSIARELSRHGVSTGDRVGLFLGRGPRLISALLGCHWAGAAYVPLDPTYPQARNRDVLEDADVAAVLTTSTLRETLPSGRWTVLEVDRLADPREGGEHIDGHIDEHMAALAEVSPEAPAYLLYTSGSTGRPKGVVITHENLRVSTGARLVAYDISPQRFLLVPSIAFDSSVAGLFWTLAVAGTLVIPTDEEARDPRRLARLIAEEEVTGLLCVPSLYGQILMAGGEVLRSLEMAIVAGESCSSQLVADHFETLPKARLFNEYGPTEATVWSTFYEMSTKDAARPVAIGGPIAGVRVEVLDGSGRPVPAGIPGQAWIVGPTVAQGYWRRPGLTAERFATGGSPGAEERRYRTGDRMTWTPDGRLLFLGREDEQIKLRGFRIEPSEIEAALLEQVTIEQAAVVARPLGSVSSSATELVAFVQAKADGSATRGKETLPAEVLPPNTWRQDLAKRLPGHMIPRRLVVLAEMPCLPNGKVDRRRLRNMVVADEVVAGADRGGREAWVPSTRELALVSLWEGLLGRSGIGPQDNFFELGGHSLLVAQLTQAIADHFEVSLAAADVFAHPTVEGLAQRIAQQGGTTAPPYQHLFPIQPFGRGLPLIFSVPHFFTHTFAERFRGERPVYGLRGVSLRAEGNRGRWPTMTDLGEDLVAEIRRRFPDEGYIMAGYSFGASMAIEAVRVMEAQGIPVRLLILIAPMPLDSYRFGPFRVQLDGVQKPIEELSAGELLRLLINTYNPLTLRPYRRAWRLLSVQTWRHLLCFLGKLRGLAGLPLTPRILHADVRLERFRLHGEYRPGPVQTPTFLFNAQEAATDAAATWRPYFRGPFTVYPTPDPHLGEASTEAARQMILQQLRDLESS